MTNDRRRGSLGPTSLPPDVGELDLTWDDDLPPALRGGKRPASAPPDPDSEFDRVTAVPELPPEVFAKSMKAAVRSAPPALPESSLGPGREPAALAAPAVEPSPLSLETVKPKRRASPDSTAPRPALSAQSLPTSRPKSPRKRAAARPIPSPTGLELDLSLDDEVVRRANQPTAPPARDPRDPSFELDLQRSLAPKPQAAPALQEMKDRYAMGDFTGALVIAESIIETSPEDLEAPRYAQNCRDVLIQMYSARLGSLNQQVYVAVPADQIRWLTLDHRAGFLLSLVDGSSSIEEILDISGMTRLDALRIMYQLLDQRVIGLR